MITQIEADLIEKIISLTADDKIIWSKIEDGNGYSNENNVIKYSIREMIVNTKEVVSIKYSVSFALIRISNGLKLVCTFYKEDKDYFVGKEHSKFSLYGGDNDKTIEYKMLNRLLVLIMSKIETKENNVKQYDILNFINYNF